MPVSHPAPANAEEDRGTHAGWPFRAIVISVATKAHLIDSRQSKIAGLGARRRSGRIQGFSPEKKRSRYQAFLCRIVDVPSKHYAARCGVARNINSDSSNGAVLIDCAQHCTLKSIVLRVRRFFTAGDGRRRTEGRRGRGSPLRLRRSLRIKRR